MTTDAWRGRVDFGIITIRKDEHEAVLARFPEQIVTVSGHRRYRLRRLTLSSAESYTIAILRCIEQGNGEAHDAARDLLEDLSPAWLLVVGIAGGVPTFEFTLGDVIVSTRIVEFSVEAVLSDHSREYSLAGGPLHRDAGKLASDISGMLHDGELGDWNNADAIKKPRPSVSIAKDRFYGDDNWRKDTLEKIKHHFDGVPLRPPSVTTGPIASSDRLIKDAEILQVWLKIARQIHAVEMESAGVYRAAQGKNVPFLAIRGLSDVVGFKRHQDWTEYACHTAAAFLEAFLRARPVPPLSDERLREPAALRGTDNENEDEPEPRGTVIEEGLASGEVHHLPAKVSTDLSLAKQLDLLDEQRDLCVIAEGDDGPINEQILEIRRQLRNGPSLVAGNTLAGRYRLITEAGDGGFATVWKALDRSTKHLVAVKVLHHRWVKNQDMIERFAKSVHWVSTLRHEAVVRVHGEAGVDDHYHYCVMDWMPGGDLHRAVTGGRLTRRVALEALARALTGLAHAHERGMIHRDVKPENILLDEHDQGWIADFDLARIMQSTRGTHTAALGSFAYAAPEQLRDASRVDARADIYSAGMCALFILAGHDPPPYVSRVDPQFISDVTCTPSLRAALEAAVAFDIDDRDLDCASLASVLHEEAGSLEQAPSSRRERGKQLERLLKLVHETDLHRQKSRIEASLSGASFVYVKLVFAWGFAVIGDESRAWELVSESLSLLGERRGDSVHALVVIKYLECIRPLCGRMRRFDQEIRNLMPDVPLDNLESFKVGRLVETSLLLNPPGLAGDAFDAWNALNRGLPANPATAAQRFEQMIEALRLDGWLFKVANTRNHDSLIVAMHEWDQSLLQQGGGESFPSFKRDLAAAIIHNLEWADPRVVGTARIDFMQKIEQGLSITTDRMSTNTHYNLALVMQIEMLVSLAVRSTN